MAFKYPIIHLKDTGENIRKLREESNMSVKDLQEYLGLESPQAIYKWQWGDCLPTLDNLVIMSQLFKTPIDQILVIK